MTAAAGSALSENRLPADVVIRWAPRDNYTVKTHVVRGVGAHDAWWCYAGRVMCAPCALSVRRDGRPVFN